MDEMRALGYVDATPYKDRKAPRVPLVFEKPLDGAPLHDGRRVVVQRDDHPPVIRGWRWKVQPGDECGRDRVVFFATPMHAAAGAAAWLKEATAPLLGAA